MKVDEDVCADQSALTGEELLVRKRLGDIVYYTTGVVRGDALGVVIASASQSFVGRTADLIGGGDADLGLQSRRTDVPYEQQDYLSVARAVAIMTCVAVLLCMCIVRIRSADESRSEMIGMALGLIIISSASGRETVIYNLRVQCTARLAKGEAIWQKPTRVEALAGVECPLR